MALPVLVTISGMVGAGKSSGEGRIIRLLRREGVPAESWRFRTLPCFTFSFGSSSRASVEAPRPTPAPRGRGYRRKPLTLSATVGYVGRIMAFRAYRRLHRTPGWAICNRYFYDSLAHFEFDAPGARRYMAMLKRLMPRPDLAILFVASPDVIAGRRPLYTPEYLQQVGAAYRTLAAQFPELVLVNTDPGHGGHEFVERLIGDLRRRLES
jgi:hypothetical protein